jgi:hypothetical protein
MRAERQIRCDDATLGLLRITDGEPRRAALPERNDGIGESPLDAAAPLAAQGVPAESASESPPAPELPPVPPSPSSGEEGGEPRFREPCSPSSFSETPDDAARTVSDPFAEGWARTIKTLSERAAEGLSQQFARGMDQLKRARKAAQSKIKDYLDQLREDDR